MRRFRTAASLFVIGVAVILLLTRTADAQLGPVEAPTGFDGLTNGLVNQAEFDQVKGIFEERETTEEGLGPVYNAQSCAECHQNPVTGGISQVTELRAGHRQGASFVEHPGGSLVHSRAIDASIQEHVLPGNEIRSFRASLNTLGDGFVECLTDETLIALAAGQASQSAVRVHGEIVMVPVLEAGGALRVGRFGWKNQHASLVSFSADAYLNEMGITSPLQPTENTSNGDPIDDYDDVMEPEDDGDDVEAFANFMRATKAPPRDPVRSATPEAQAGEQVFNQLGCAVCHVATLVTAAPGTPINGGQLTVPPALGNKIIHPFSDFLLHDVGTGDGIVQNGGQSTRNKVRTAPLWGLRTHNRLMHDGLSFTLEDAILRHRREAAFARSSFRGLSAEKKGQLLTFLRSL